MAEKKVNQMAEHLKARGMEEAVVPESEKGVTTLRFGLGKAARKALRKPTPK